MDEALRVVNRKIATTFRNSKKIVLFSVTDLISFEILISLSSKKENKTLFFNSWTLISYLLSPLKCVFCLILSFSGKSF